MAIKKTHIEQGKHNEQLFDYLENTPYSDWRVTATFYAALHYVDAYFHSLNPPIHCRIHPDRDNRVATLPGTQPIYSEYRNLKDLSEAARYAGRKFTPAEIKTDVTPSLQKIKKQLKQFL